MRTRGRKIIRDIGTRKTRTILVAASIFVGVLGVVVLTTIGQLLTRQLEKDLKPDELAMLRIYINSDTASDLENAVALERLRRFPDITDVEGQAVYQFTWQRTPDDTPHKGQLFAYSEPFEEIHIEPLRLVKGQYPKAGQQEIAIEQRMATVQGLQVGDSLIINDVSWRIVGIVFQPYIYIGSGEASTSAYAAYADARRIVGFNGYSSLYVRFKDFNAAARRSADFRRYITQQTPYTIIFHLLDDPAQNTFIIGVQRFSRVLFILAMVAMVVASFLVINVITTIIAEQRRQIGAMKALGATRWDILFMYLGTAFGYGFLGTLPALMLGIFIGQRAAEAAAPLANTILQDTTPPPLALLLGTGMGLGMPVLAALIPIWSGSRISILEAMSDQGLTSRFGRRSLLAWLIKHLPVPIAVEQVLNNIIQNRTRLILTVLALVMASAAFMGMFAVFFVLNGVINDIREKLHVEISLNPTQLEVLDLVQATFITPDENQIRAIQPGVAVQLPVELQPDTVKSDEPHPTIYVTGIDTTTDLAQVNVVEGVGWSENPNQTGIVLSQSVAAELQVGLGESLYLISPQKVQAFKVIGLADFPFGTAFMEWQQLADFVGVIRDAPTPNAFWVRTQVKSDNVDNLLANQDVWTIGIDEQVGAFLSRDFNPDTPGVVISRRVAIDGGYSIGDTINLQSRRVSSLEAVIEVLQDHSVSYPIVGIVDVNIAQLRLMTQDAPEEVLQSTDPMIIAMYWPLLAELSNIDYQTFAPKTFLLNLSNPSATTDSPSDRPIPVFTNQLGFADRIAQTILSLGLVMNMASLLMAVVGGIGLLTIMSINVFERQRQIGVMRSVGATSWVIMSQFLLEGLLIGVLAWAIAIPISYRLSQFLVSIVPFNEVITYHYTLLAPGLGLIGTLLITFLATLYPAFRASRKTVSEILRYQ